MLSAAGATTLIIKRWGRNDAPSNEIVAKFYEKLAAGQAPAAALAAAQAALRRAKEARAPAAWAGWLVLDGK